MTAIALNVDDQYVLNHATKYLARTNQDDRHNYNNRYSPQDPRGRIVECWRFPVLDTFRDPVTGTTGANVVTFIYDSALGPAGAKQIEIVGSFAPLFAPLPLRQILFAGQPTKYWAAAVKIPWGEVHRYLFLIDGVTLPDPINPQRVTDATGQEYSQFFTDYCTQPLSFERWEMDLLMRLTDHILPFETADAQTFLDQFYNSLDQQSQETTLRFAFRLDEPIGVSNFIDNLLAREEHHNLLDYKICLEIIDKILRQRNPYMEPAEMPKQMYIDLYDQMATGNMADWDYSQYGDPHYFLQLLRRHTWTGAFSHPKYGGNAGAAGWDYLEQNFVAKDGSSVFNWRRAFEPPLGQSADYHG